MRLILIQEAHDKSKSKKRLKNVYSVFNEIISFSIS